MSRISLTPLTSSTLGSTPARLIQSPRDRTRGLAATLAASTTPKDLPRIALPAGGAREAKTGALSARASTLRACVAEATRAIRSVRFFPREELTSLVHEAPPLSPLGLALTPPRMTGTLADVSSSWPSQPS